MTSPKDRRSLYGGVLHDLSVGILKADCGVCLTEFVTWVGKEPSIGGHSLLTSWEVV